MTPIRTAIVALIFLVSAAWSGSAFGQWPGYPLGEVAVAADGRAAEDERTPTSVAALHSELASLRQRMDSLAGEGDVVVGCGCESDCNWNDCGCDDDCCGCSSSRNGFYIGGEAAFAKPYYKEAFEASLTNLATTAQTLLPFHWDYQATPRVWLGYTDCDGLGVRARFWDFDQEGETRTLAGSNLPTPTAHVVSVIFPATIIAPAGTTMSVSNSLLFRTLDLEGTKQLQIGSTELMLGAGLRYALLDQRYDASVTVTGSRLTWQRRFEGLGLTMSAEGRQPIGCRGLAAVGSFRGAMLFGQKDMNRTVIGNVAPNVGDGPITLDGGDDVFGGGELGLGLEWSREMPSGREIFVRGTYEGQLWTDGGAPTLTFLAFQGFAVSAGIFF